MTTRKAKAKAEAGSRAGNDKQGSKDKANRRFPSGMTTKRATTSEGRGSLGAFEGHGYGVAAAEAEGGYALLRVAADHLVKQRDEHTGA